jgi:DNA-binding phage protein
VTQTGVYVLTGHRLCEALVARLERARSVEDYVHLCDSAARVKGRIARGAEMASFAAKIGCAADQLLRAVRDGVPR